MTAVRVLAPYFPPAVAGGGPIRTLDALTRAAPSRMHVEVLTRDRDLQARVRLDVPRSPVRDAHRTVHFLDTGGPTGTLRLARAIRRGPRPDLTYANSVFDPLFGILPSLLERCATPRGGRLLVAPRGEFDPGALALQQAKKHRYLTLARHAGLFRRTVWHASTELEAANIRAVVGDDAVVVVRENETMLPAVARRSPVRVAGRLELVTVGRISPKKRTHLLLEALAEVSVPVRLVVVGPVDDQAYGRKCEALARALPGHVRAEFRGTRTHDEVLASIEDAHAMVTATAGENFGHTIVEAMSVGRPVLLPDTTPWSGRVAAGGGEVVPDDGWADVLEQLAREDEVSLTRRATDAADAYDAWRSARPAPHVFELALGL